MGCYLEDYRARVGAWAGRLARPVRSGLSGSGDARQAWGLGLGVVALSSTILAVLLVIGGIEQNPGPVMDSTNAIKLSCTGCSRNLRTGIQCELCGHWYHYSCGNVKGVWTEREKWNCDKCKTERVRVLQHDLQTAYRQIEELKERNKELEDLLKQERVERREPAPVKGISAKCLLVGDSIIRNVGAEQEEIRVECFPGIKTDQLRRVVENTDLGSPETVIVHVGTNDLRNTRNLDWTMGEAYDLVATIKKKLPSSRLIMSGVIRRKDTKWRRVGALNGRLEWIAEAFGITFVDPNSWLEDEDFGRDGIHLNGRGKSRLGQLYTRVGGLAGNGDAARGK